MKNQINTTKDTRYDAFVFIFILIVVAFILHRVQLWVIPEGIKSDGEHHDVWYFFRDSKLLYKGINPYSLWRTNPEANPLDFFPLFALIGLVPMFLGYTTYSSWVSVMRVLYLAAELGIGAIIFRFSTTKKRPLLGLLGVSIWFFNLTTIKVWEILQTDSIVIFLALLGVYYLEKRPILANILLGCSVSIKQISVFLIPLFIIKQMKLIPIIEITKKTQIKELIKTLFFILLVPFIISLPFLFLDYESLIKGLLFEAVRTASSHQIGKHSEILRYIADLFNIPAIITRIPMLLAFLGLYIFYYKQEIDKYLFASLTFGIYLYFNSVVYKQYFVWPIPFIIIGILVNGFIKDFETQKSVKSTNHPHEIGIGFLNHIFNRIREKSNQILQEMENFYKPQQRSAIIFGIIFFIASILRITIIFVTTAYWSVLTLFLIIGDIGIGGIIFKLSIEKEETIWGIYCVIFWFFNTGTLYIFQNMRVDGIALFLAVLALYILQNQSNIACLILGISIALSPFMIIFIPMFLINKCQVNDVTESENTKNSSSKHLRLKSPLGALFTILIIPICLSPFLYQDYLWFLKYLIELEIPFFLVLFGLLFVSYAKKEEISWIGYAGSVASVFFYFTHYVYFFWFLFIILYIVVRGDNIIQGGSNRV